jgi:tetratricopeptide (TPR) repeat protein
MKTSLCAPLLWLAASCATTPVSAPRPAPVAPVLELAPSEPWTSPAESGPAATEPVLEPVAQQSSAKKPGDELWSDATFRRRLIESYASETDIEPKVTQIERESMQKVLELISTEKFDLAVVEIEKLRGAGASAVIDFTLANIYFQREELDKAIPVYETAVEKFPRFRRAWRNLALIHVRQGDHRRASTALTRVIELGGGDALTYGLLGFASSNLENHLAAESAYRMANLLDPATQDWKMGLARCFFKQRRFDDAAALCGTMLAEQPDRADLWLLQANAYIGLGQRMRAAENYEIVERMGAGTADSQNMLGDIYVNEELFELAVAAYTRALERNPAQSSDRAVRAARVLMARGAVADARRLVEDVQRLRAERLSESERKDLLKLRARLAVAEGASGDEVRILEEIVALDPLDGEALILLGQHAQRSNDPDRAIFLFERAAAIESFEADAKVRHAQLLVGLGRYSEALPLLRRAQTVKPRENIQEYMEQVERVANSR